MNNLKKVVLLTVLATGGAVVAKKVTTNEKLKEKADRLNTDLKSVKDSSIDLFKEVVDQANNRIKEKTAELKAEYEKNERAKKENEKDLLNNEDFFLDEDEIDDLDDIIKTFGYQPDEDEPTVEEETVEEETVE